MLTSKKTPARVRHTATALLATATLIALAGCTSTGTSAATPTSDVSGGTLTMQFAGPPIDGLDPSHEAGGQSVVYSSLAYDSLLFQEPNGTIAPDLATKWKWVGSGNQVLDLTIRSGVKFSDGTSLTPAAVVTWLNYFKDTSSIRNYELADMKSAAVSGAHGVTITLTDSNPDLPLLLTQTYGAGFVASPSAIAKKGSLNAATDGTGPYKLDPSETVTGDTYTYIKNPKYWNPSAVHYDKVVVKAIPDSNTILSALQSGQLDVALGDPSTAEQAASSGLKVKVATGSGIVSLLLLDRAGSLVPALGSQKVRQAINYAIDRPAIVKALYPDGHAKPTAQVLRAGQPGFSKKNDSYYPYSLSKAKQLLAAAGYAKGFTFTAMCSTILGTCPIAQAVASSLAKAGITMTIDSESQIATFNQKFSGAAVPAVFYGIGDATFLSAQQLIPTNSFQNPFKSTDSALSADYAQLAKADTPAAESAAATALNKRLLELAWFAPVVRTDQLYYFKGVGNVTVTSKAPNYYSPVDPSGKHSWKPAS